MYKAYKFRLYPNKQQEELIQKTFGCCRFVYNYYLDYRIKKYKENEVSISRFDCNGHLANVLKKEYEWLREVDSTALQNAIKNLDNAYKKFFKEHTGYPKFKSKRDNHKSYTSSCVSNNIRLKDGNKQIQLPKLKDVKIRGYRNTDISGKIKTATVSQEPNGEYYVSVVVDTEHEPIQSTGGAVGIDLGLTHLIITSDGEKFENNRAMQQLEKKLAREQRRLAHKKKGSSNHEKQRIKVAKVYAKIRNMRKYYIHEITTELISENQVIVSEDLNVSGMLKNRHLSKAITDACWSEITRQLAYKAEWNGRQYVQIDTFFPSSQICNECGHRDGKKELNVREWTCSECGTHHDRDVNAAVNILNEGLKTLKEIR